MSEQPQVIAFMLGEEIAPDDPHRAIKERARELWAISDAREVEASAAAVGQLVDALACESLDVAEMCDASGLDDSGVDAATYVALVLRLAELGELDDG